MKAIVVGLAFLLVGWVVGVPLGHHETDLQQIDKACRKAFNCGLDVIQSLAIRFKADGIQTDGLESQMDNVVLESKSKADSIVAHLIDVATNDKRKTSKIATESIKKLTKLEKKTSKKLKEICNNLTGTDDQVQEIQKECGHAVHKFEKKFKKILKHIKTLE